MNFAVAVAAACSDGRTVRTLTSRVHQRKGGHEARFDTRFLPAELPVTLDGQLVLAPGGKPSAGTGHAGGWASSHDARA